MRAADFWVWPVAKVLDLKMVRSSIWRLVWRRDFKELRLIDPPGDTCGRRQGDQKKQDALVVALREFGSGVLSR